MSDRPMQDAAPLDNTSRGETTAPGRTAALTIFISAIFLSAALLFMVQPMFTKMVLPRLGGAASVWSCAIVFFQTALLAGYAYAHWLNRLAPGRACVIVHVAVLATAAISLPLGVAAGWERPPPAGEAFWLIGLFAASIGLPFFTLSANSPLLQAWFAASDDPAAKDPYFLFVASNIGSFLALLSYPFLLEPFVRLTDQSRLWSIGFFLLLLLIACCGILRWRWPSRMRSAAAGSTSWPGSSRPSTSVSPETLEDKTWMPGPRPGMTQERRVNSDTADRGAAADAPPGWQDATFWMAMAAVPSGLLIAVTAYISTDIAAVPLLWVVPLALYLLSFIVVFARRPIVPHWLVVALQPLFIIALIGVIVLEPIKTIVWLIAIHVVVFFVCALMCHGELARWRPAPRYLTAFYLWLSAGGVIGGIASALVAPHVFNWLAEYPLLLALAVLCRPGRALPRNGPWRYLVFSALIAAGLFLILCAYFPSVFDVRTFNRAVAALLIASVLFWRSPLAFAAIVGSVLFANQVLFDQSVLSARSFFGVAKVVESPDHEFRILQHGTTLHGAQRIRDANGQPVTGPPELLLYYSDGSAIAQTIEAVRERTGPIKFAVIGLGAGALACRASPDDTLHFYEIDPAIIRIARDPDLFSFLWICRPEVPITLGDARLTLADAADGAYDLIIVDAFSSDAIPIHLLTREAMATYLKKLSSHGMIVMHVSNRHLELASVVAGIAKANNLVARVNDSAEIEDNAGPYIFAGTVAAVVRTDQDFGRLAQLRDWEPLAPDPRQWSWTDDYSDVFGAVLRKLRE
jgi:hypothetical protein